MVAKTKESSKALSPISQLAGWARQGIESFAAAQKVLFDLTARQNAVVIGMVQERLSRPGLRPGDMLAPIADKGVETLTAAGKVLLDLAAGETALVADWAKEPAVGALSDVVRHRADAFIDMQKRLLDVAAEQTHAIVESYRQGNVRGLGESVAELAKRGIEGLVETEKKFLDSAVHEVTAASKPGKEGKTAARNQLKILTQLAREGVEQYIDVQKKLLDLAIDQLEFTGEASGEHIKAIRDEVRRSWGELTAKSVWNFVAARQSLRNLAAKPLATAETRKIPRARPRAKKRAGRTRKAA
jgi:hypothetical protein